MFTLNTLPGVVFQIKELIPTLISVFELGLKFQIWFYDKIKWSGHCSTGAFLSSWCCWKMFIIVIEYLLELFFPSDFYGTELNQSLFAGMHKQKAVCKQ